MISTRPLISESPSPCSNPLVTVPIALITIGIVVTFMFHSFFNSLARFRFLSLFSHSFNFTLWSAGTAKSTILQVLFFLFFFLLFFYYYKIWSSGRDLVIRFCLKSRRSLCPSFSWTDSGLCIYHLFVWSNFNFLHSSQWITLPTQSCLVLYSLLLICCIRLLWLIVSSLSPQNLHLLFCWVLSIFALIWLVVIALFCAAIRRDSISLLRFPFLRQVHVFTREMSLVYRLKYPYNCY